MKEETQQATTLKQSFWREFFTKNRMREIGLHVFQLFLFLMVSNLLLSSFLFVLHQTISWVVLPLSFLIAVGLLILFYGSKLNFGIFIEIAIAIVIFVVFTFLIGSVFDISWDGNDYHKLAVGLMANGWNPVYELPSVNTVFDGNSSVSSVWAECYTKMTWIFAASVYAVFGNIECGKVYIILAMLMVLLLTFFVLSKIGKKIYISLPFACLAALNPVAIAQCTSFYIDGFLHLMLFVLLLSLYMLYRQDVFNKKVSLALIASSLIVCANIKFTGLLFGGVFCVVYFVLFCFKEKKLNPSGYKKAVLTTLCVFAGMAVVAVVWAGSNSYIVNFVRHGNPLYPLLGEGKIDIMTPNSSFTEVNHFKNFFVSLFSYMQNFAYTSGLVPTLKIPFTFNYDKEFAVLGDVDARLSGFGILFSGLFVIALGVIVTKLILLFKNKQHEKFWLVLVNVLMFFGLTFAITESWWARYAPCVYFILLLGVYFALDAGKVILKIFGFVFLCVALLNSCLFLSSPVKSCALSQDISSELSQITDKTLYVNSEGWQGIYFNLKDRGIKVVIESDVDVIKAKPGAKQMMPSYYIYSIWYAPYNST